METENTASRQRGQTVRIITDIPVLVQTPNTVKREGRSNPISLRLGNYTVTLSLTDSGLPVVKIEPP